MLDNPIGERFDLAVSREGGKGEIFVHEAKLEIESEWRPGLPTISACIDGDVVNVNISRTSLGFHLVSGTFALDIIPVSYTHLRAHET